MMDKQSPTRHDDHEAVAGLLLPAFLLVLVSLNLVTGKAWGPAGRGTHQIIHTYTDAEIVYGLALLKLGVAIGLFAWFWMANRETFDRFIAPIQISAIAIASLGVTLIAKFVALNLF